MLHVGVKQRNGAFRLLDDGQFLKGRGTHVFRSGEFDLDRQKELAKQFNLCPKIVGTRICGNGIKKQRGQNRRTCARCPKMIATYQGPPVVHKQTLYEGSHQYCVPHVQSDLPAVETRDAGTQTDMPNLTIVHTGCVYTDGKDWTLKTVFEDIWGENKRQTKANVKTCIKRALGYLDLTYDNRPHELIAAMCKGTPDLFIKIWDGKDSKNTCKRFERLCYKVGATKPAQRLYELRMEHAEAGNPNILRPARKKAIQTIADNMGVSLDGPKPGARLLKAMQDRVIEYSPQNEEQRRWAFHMILGLFLPATRAGASRFIWADKLPTSEDEWKACNENLAILDDDDDLILFFGALKFSDMKSRPNGWMKRFYIDSDGLHGWARTAQIPKHMEFTWTPIMNKLRLLMMMQARECPTAIGERVFHVSEDEAILPRQLVSDFEDFWGVRFGSYMQRLVFRNGTHAVDDCFYRYVMSHTPSVDQLYYVKPELMDGPWLPDGISSSDREEDHSETKPN